MEYKVFQYGKLISSFEYFHEAWLYIFLELKSYAIIRGHDGNWIVNPASSN